MKIYLERLENEGLEFPVGEVEVAEELKNLITGCLQVDPSKRL